jgi:hypothetical protein
VGFEVLTEAVMKSSVFCDKTRCSQLKVYPLFRSNMSSPSSGLRISQLRNQRESRWKADLVSCLVSNRMFMSCEL